MLAYPFTMVLHPKFNKKIDTPVYTGHQPPRRFGHHLNLSLMPNSNHASTGTKPLCLNIVFNKNLYHIETKQLTRIADQ